MGEWVKSQTPAGLSNVFGYIYSSIVIKIKLQFNHAQESDDFLEGSAWHEVKEMF